HNSPREMSDPTAHAEILALRRAAEKLGNERLEGCELWVTLEPCAMCAGALAHARIARLYYAAPDPKGGAVEHGARGCDQPQCLHRPEPYSGMGEEQAAALLRDFFAARRGGLQPAPDGARGAVGWAELAAAAGRRAVVKAVAEAYSLQPAPAVDFERHVARLPARIGIGECAPHVARGEVALAREAVEIGPA